MPRSATVLVVDPDPGSSQAVGRWLEAADYSVLMAAGGREGLDTFLSRRPDLVLLEALLPEMDGLELCRRIRSIARTPVIFLSALDRPDERTRGLASGADDYLVKPADADELLGRVSAVLRRAGVSTAPGETLVAGPLRVDARRREVAVSGVDVSLTPLEFSLLQALVERSGEVVSSVDLLNSVWGPEYWDRGLVKWHMMRLRRKLEGAGLPRSAIASVRGVGYGFRIFGEGRTATDSAA